MTLQTPFYLIDKTALLRNLRLIERVRRRSGARVLLALKCFAAWSVFDLMHPHMDGTTSSSLYEVRLGREKFGGETHAYSVAFADHEIDEVIANADKIVFNSVSQFERFAARAAGIGRGLRINPGFSSSGFDLADPARPFSRLGEADPARLAAIADRLDGLMIHNNCENADFGRFASQLDLIEQKFGPVLAKMDWISLGGGIHFTAPYYPLDAFCERLRAFADRFGVQVYLEPGEAAITGTTTLEVTVLDTLFNGRPIAIVDSSIEAHMLDLLVYRQSARIAPATIVPVAIAPTGRAPDGMASTGIAYQGGGFDYLVCGKSCLAGDVFGEFRAPLALEPGDRLSIQDAAGYTMVKKNWFNGVAMPAIVLRELDGRLTPVREFSFADYVASLS